MKTEVKKKITIEVDPEMAVIAMGLIRGFMPSIFQHMSNTMNEMLDPMKLDPEFESKVSNILNEIYEKCIAETSIREGAANLMEILELTGTFPDKTEN